MTRSPVDLSSDEIAAVRSWVIHEDAHIIAFSKPAGLSSQGGRIKAHTLDDLLWAFDEEAFVPHQIAGSDDDEDEAAVLIATPDSDVALRPLVINLRDGVVEGTFDRVLEVVPADPSARGPLRERWKHYQSNGFDVKKHDM